MDFLLGGGVDGIFVLGTTGEGASVPRTFRRRLVERTVARVQRRAMVYAGIGDLHPDDVAVGNDYFQAGVDVAAGRPPVAFPLQELLPWFQSLLAGLEGPLVLYNMPTITYISISLSRLYLLRMVRLNTTERCGCQVPPTDPPRGPLNHCRSSSNRERRRRE